MLEPFKSKPLFNMVTISTLMLFGSADEKYFKS
jgi:hypothetical protein